MRKTDEEIYTDYLIEMGGDPSKMDPKIFQAMVSWVHKIREDEPRINSWVHLHDYTMICDDDDDMDSFYGKDYFDG